uniref:Peptidase S1 domain-containing protein n=2 Tax=Clytia hemisphaerica TaxID=252671 RepID=A0A7M5V4T2_9CNID
MHPSYTGRNLNYDVALVELSKPLRMNDRVVRACLPQQGVYPQIGKNCYVAGWGRVSVSPSRSPNRLQQAKLPILEQSKCGSHFVCTGYGYGSQGRPHPNICQGDSGGPLMCQKSDGLWQLEGAASWVLKDCTIYSAYAALHKYIPFVRQHVRDL